MRIDCAELRVPATKTLRWNNPEDTLYPIVESRKCIASRRPFPTV